MKVKYNHPAIPPEFITVESTYEVKVVGKDKSITKDNGEKLILTDFMLEEIFQIVK